MCSPKHLIEHKHKFFFMSKNNQLHNYQATFSRCKNCATDKPELSVEKSRNALNNACEQNMAQENVNRTSAHSDNASNFCKLKNSSVQSSCLEHAAKVVSPENLAPDKTKLLT